MTSTWCKLVGMILHFLLPLLLWGCADPSPSILLVTLDTTRADRLGPYGYASADTPAYDALAAQGTVFERAYSTCPLTIPSHATILTGRVPPSHGVRDNGDFVLGDDAVTLAERLQDAGYTTAAFTAAFPTQRRWGLAQGFEVYSDRLDDLPTRLDWRDERRADEVVDDALAWLGTTEGPAFAWVHLFDAHWPYAPPEPFASEHRGAPYDGEIAFAAHEVGRLLAQWDRRYPDSVVVVTADHGEGLGDGGERTHGFLLHDGTIRVPLIVRGAGFTPGSRVEDPVSHVDIAPTILSLAGLAVHTEVQGRDLRRGGTDRPYSEALTGQFNLGLAPLYAYTDGGGRYMEGAWGAWYPRLEERVVTVEDHDADLQEPATRLASMRATFDEVIAEEATLDSEAMAALVALGYLGGDPAAPAGEVDPRDVIDVIPLTWQVRQALGQHHYRQAARLLGRLERRMPGTYGVDALRAQLLLSRGRHRAAYQAHVDLYLRAPSSTVALRLGGLAMRMRRPDEAEEWFVEALERHTVSPEAMAGHVRAILAHGGRDAEAEALADDYISRYPDHAELVLLRATLHLRQGRPELALKDAERAIRDLPRRPRALATLAEAHWALGDADVAIERMKDARRIDRHDRRYRVTLAEWLLEVGREAEALRTIAPAARLAPWDDELQSLHAEAQARLDSP